MLRNIVKTQPQQAGDFDAADAMIREIYRARLDEVQALAASGEAEACMTRAFELWMFMNRFRNCDLRIYFDEGLHEAIASLNPRRFDTSHLVKKKQTFNVAFIMTGMVDTGSASVSHRFMLEAKHAGGRFKHHVLITNLRPGGDNTKSESYRYLIDEIRPESVVDMPAMPWLEKGRFIEQWLHEKQIDFVVAAPCPATLYAFASRPALLQGVLSQDCYTFTLGPGAGDLTFLVTTDQVFKYKFKDPAAAAKLKVVMLPLHGGDYVDAAVPMSRAELGVPEGAILSGSTNLWKSFFGDAEILLEGIAALVRKHPNYHHVFAGTPRCRDNLEFFLNKNPDVRPNIHFAGEIKNIYRFLKTTDFWVNSFPTSGGSDIESAIVGKPTVSFLFNRNLTLHGAEFLRSRECDVVSLDEFVALGSRFITDEAYRDDLGAFLRQKILREFDKDRIVREKIYGSFETLFEEKLAKRAPLKPLDLDGVLAYEKALALYNAHGRSEWSAAERVEWLEACRERYPEKPFAWIKLIEEALLAKDAARFRSILAELPESIRLDGRIHVMAAYGHAQFGDRDAAEKSAARGRELLPDDAKARQVAERIKTGGKPETLPLYYDY